MGKGGSDKYIHNWGEEREGACLSCDSKGVWGSADSSSSGVWCKTPAAFLLLRLFSMKFTVISYTVGDAKKVTFRLTKTIVVRWCLTSYVRSVNESSTQRLMC